MKTNQLFSWKRFASVVKLDLLDHKKGIIIALSIILGIHFIIHISSAFTGPSKEIHTIFFANTLFIAGVIATSLTFRDYYRNDKAYFEILLPASRFEKYLSKFIITTAGYVIGGIIVYFFYWLFASGVTAALYGTKFTIFNPFTSSLWRLIGGYIVVHSVFFFGAVYFKRAAYLKTILALVVLSLILMFIAIIVAALSAITWIGDLIPFAMGEAPSIQFPRLVSATPFMTVMGEIARLFVLFVMTPALWLIGFFRYREIEVR